MPKGKPPAEFPEELVRAISLAVFRERLSEEGYQRLLAKDKGDPQKMRNRAVGYDALTRSYLKAISKHGT